MCVLFLCELVWHYNVYSDKRIRKTETNNIIHISVIHVYSNCGKVHAIMFVCTWTFMVLIGLFYLGRILTLVQLKFSRISHILNVCLTAGSLPRS